MNKYQIIVLFCFLCPIVAFSQKDTLMKKANLEEVFIQGANKHLNAAEKNNQKNVQSSIDHLLEQMSGVSLIKRGNYAQEPTIRGLNAAQINLSIDGMAMFGACTDRMDPISSYLEPNNLQSITASFSSDATSFGSSVGGGFNFKVRQPQLNAENVWSGRVGLGYESNGNAFQSLASLNYSKKKFALNANGIFRKSGNYFAGGGEEVLFSQYNKWNGGISAKYQVHKNHLLSAQYIQDEGYDIGYPGLTMDVAYAKAKIGSFSHMYFSNGKSLEKWETKFYFNSIDHAMDDTKRPAELVPMHMDMPGTSQTFGMYSDMDLNFNHTNHLNIRMDAYQNRLHAEMTMYPDSGAEMFMLTIPDAQRSVIGLSASNHHVFSNKWSLMFGGRLEYNGSSLYSELGKQTLSGIHEGDLNRSNLVYNFYMNPEFILNDTWSFFGQVAKGMRAPSLKELYGFYLFNRADNYDYIGNPNLKNEQSWNLNLRTKFQKDRIKIEARVFAYLFQNYIAGIQKNDFSVMTIGATGVKAYSNLHAAQLFGAEIGLNVMIFKNLSFHSNNSVTYGKDDQNRALPLIPPFKTVNEISYSWNSYAFDVTGIYSTAQNHIDEQFYGESSTPSFGIMNLGIKKTFDFKTTNLMVNIGMNNLFDTKYFEHLDLMKVPRMGRNWLAQVTFNF